MMRSRSQAKGATLVSVTSVPGCKLESVCDLAVVLPLVRSLQSQALSRRGQHASPAPYRHACGHVRSGQSACNRIVPPLITVVDQVRELCPFDLAPVTSTAIQMLFGDTVAIALMQVTWHVLIPLQSRTLGERPFRCLLFVSAA